MIDRLMIRNFQAHEDTRLEFGRITTIVGDSDVGKSSILRAIWWLCFNRPRGDAFLRDGADRCRVRIRVTDNGKHTIERSRSSDGNIYRLDGREFRAIGGDVPDDVARVVNVDSINYQSQHDSPFWFALTSGEVARQLSAIVDLDVIDKCTSEINGRCRRAKTLVDVTRERLESARVERDALGYTRQLDKDLRHLEMIDAQIDAVDDRRNRIRELIRSGVTEHKRYRDIHRASRAAAGLVSLTEQVANVHSSHRRLLVLIRSVELLLVTSELSGEYGKVHAIAQNYGGVSDRRRRLVELIESTEGHGQEHRQLEEEYNELVRRGVCPNCGQSVLRGSS